MIPIAIVAHSERAERAEKLADAVKAEFLSVDDGKLGAGRNHERCWHWLAEGKSDWSVVLEDDALPIKGFRDQLDEVLRLAPTPIVSLYLGRSRPQHWQPSISKVIARPECFLVADELLHHVGVAIKTPLLPVMLDDINAGFGYQNRMGIDEAIGRWARRMSIKVAYTHPSIVQHDLTLPTVIRKHLSTTAGESGDRTLGQREYDPHENRRAWMFGTRQTWDDSATDIPSPHL